MKIRTKSILALVLIFAVTACSQSAPSTSDQTSAENLPEENIPSQPDPGAPDEGEDSDESESVVDPSTSVSVELADIHEESDDYVWDAGDLETITLNGNSIQTESTNIEMNGSQVTITSAGNYWISGELSDGQIVVDTNNENIVRLILDDVNIHNSTGSAIYIANAEKTIIVLNDGSQNSLSDGSNYDLPDPESDEPNAALFSKDDLTITGSGSLSIVANYNDAIGCKDGLIINGGSTIVIQSIDDGIRGKDYVVIDGAVLHITANGDGMKSDESEDTSRGFIVIESGNITIVSGTDAIEAETDIIVLDGNFSLQSGGGSSAIVDETTSGKGIKATRSLTISGGSYAIDSADDGLHSNDSITIQGGVFSIASGDDGMHADSVLTIDDGVIDIVKSYEGLESAIMYINAGDIQIYASDDGINLAGGADDSGTLGGGQGGQQTGKHRGDKGDSFTQMSSYYLYINGGTVVVNAEGDGIDSNGSIEMTGGTVLVDGPTESMNGALDYLGTFNISGGILIAVGSAGMALAPSDSSTQASLVINFDSYLRSEVLIHIETETGETVLNYAPSKPYQSVVISTPELIIGETYTLFVGGGVDGADSESLLPEGRYSNGTEVISFTITSTITQLGRGGMNRGW